MGSDSDLKTLKPAIDILNEFEIENEVCILSAHRTPIEMMEYAKKAESENIKVINTMIDVNINDLELNFL